MAAEMGNPEKKTFAQMKKSLALSKRAFLLVWQFEKRLLTISALITVVPAGLPFVNAYIYKLTIDQVVSFVSTNTIDQSLLYFLFFARFVSYFLQDIISRIQGHVEHHLWTRAPIALQDMVLEKISNLDIQYFEDSEFKNLLEKARDGLTYRPQALITSIIGSLEASIRLGIATVALVNLNSWLILAILCIAIPEFIMQTKLSNLGWGIWNWKSAKRKRYWNLHHILQDAGSIKETKLYNLSPKFLRDLHDIQIEFYKEDSIHAKRRLIYNAIFNFFSSTLYIGIEIYTILLVLVRKITIGDIGFYTSVVSNFQWGLGGFLRNINEIYDSGLYVESLFEILDTKPLIIEATNPVRIVATKPPRIEFRHVDFVYPGTRKKILNDFSIVIEPGQKVALVGENGAGKSTIIKLLARLYDVTRGEILVNDVPLKDVSIVDWRACIGVLFQDFNRYDYTVKENIWYGRIEKKPDTKSISEAAQDAAAHGLIQKFNDKYDQMLGRTFDEGVEPSGGQWQKIALARAFFRDAPILVLDEPTASIDAKAEAEIFHRVEKLSQGKTTVIISHRFSTVRKADLIYVIDNGKIVESGNHAQLMKKKGQYATLFSLQATGYV